ncbi:hypothetical protein NDU88_003373 [Pleurodeles waltl]|uniref:Uncharacterized protein n=1 Tax=Pleurodeles waltl TaxID=8319 RepID=A0AAV7TNW0_PLEWA|nr:hypothetical protein NDU88_003373 [Pleurodeles waltl]
MPCRHQHVPTTNPEAKRGPVHTWKTGRTWRRCLKSKNTRREEEKWAAEEGTRTKSCNEAAQQHKEDVKGERSTGEIDKAPLPDSAARHVRGGTWLAQITVGQEGAELWEVAEVGTMDELFQCSGIILFDLLMKQTDLLVGSFLVQKWLLAEHELW